MILKCKYVKEWSEDFSARTGCFFIWGFAGRQ